MAEASFITQVQRPEESNASSLPADSRPTRKPKLKLDVDGSASGAVAPMSPSDEKSPSSDVDNRVTGLGKIFSRQFTPTAPKTSPFFDKDKDKAAAQSPKGPKNPQALTTHNENEEEEQTTSDQDKENSQLNPGGVNSPTGRKTLWQSIWSCFLSDNGEHQAAAGSAPEIPPTVRPSQEMTAAPLAVDKPVADVVEEYPYDPNSLLARNVSGKKMCLVLDLDETLVHSSFKPVPQCDFVLSIEMDGVTHKVYVLKRPGVDEFLLEMSKYFELVIFTASLDKYANPLLDLLDIHKVLGGRLYREHCTRQGQMYIKDLSRLGRNLGHTIIIDNSPHSYALHTNYAVPILSWFDDPNDTELLDMMPFLQNLTKLNDVSQVLDAGKPWRVTNKKLVKLLETEAGSA